MRGLAEHLERIRKGQGLSQDTLAHMLGICAPHYNRIARGRQDMTMRVAVKAMRLYPELVDVFLSDVIGQPVAETVKQ